MKETVMVKHAVTGLELLNNNKHSFTYELIDLPAGGFRMTLVGAPEEIVQDILTLQNELNLFRFELPEDAPQIKHWYYVKEHGVQYQADQQQLIIEASSEIVYLPSEYLE
ncbi:hypothetical protein QE450_003495 [Paenibacillus sp. SORGH_AS306]|uniref:hypothetical protein n=1 Tax=unclassified Paenibacillus TaxID=185978 RepID=UPI0027885F25|nr:MULTISPECIES: hypothetical protein [unclassified Paenibacillus]MDQ1235997.1 hypothetical protein [Paenibacillus sp. SORGH_AS_0306]MDR6108354.1 hypothetical protein [Paenibacillus sp. SORGH_AS_0338]